MLFRFLVGVSTSAIVCLSGPAIAATLKVSGGITCSTPGGLGYDQVSVGSGLVPLTASVERSDRGCSGGSQAIAGGGLVGGLSRSTVSEVIPGQSSSASFLASAESRFSIETPESYTGGDIEISVNALVHGLIEANLPYDPFAFASPFGAQAQLSYNLLLSGNNTDGTTPGTSIASDVFQLIVPAVQGSTSTATGTHEVNERITTQTLMLDPTAGVRVRFTLSASGGISGFLNSSAVNALNTFSFDPLGPAFNLPTGFFINSDEANIINNHWIDPRAIVAPSTVPLPANGILALSSLTGLMAVRRRKIQSS
jgi:hypothetical protein